MLAENQAVRTGPGNFVKRTDDTVKILQLVNEAVSSKSFGGKQDWSFSEDTEWAIFTSLFAFFCIFVQKVRPCKIILENGNAKFLQKIRFFLTKVYIIWYKL